MEKSALRTRNVYGGKNKFSVKNQQIRLQRTKKLNKFHFCAISDESRQIIMITTFKGNLFHVSQHDLINFFLIFLWREYVLCGASKDKHKQTLVIRKNASRETNKKLQRHEGKVLF